MLFWQLTDLGVACEVIAPSLVPTKAGDRVKTDRRDAEKLARSCRAGDLTAVWVPDGAHEALRALVRTREDAKQDQLRWAAAKSQDEGLDPSIHGMAEFSGSRKPLPKPSNNGKPGGRKTLW